MSFKNKLYQSELVRYLPKFIIRKLRRKLNCYFVEIPLNTLPNGNYPQENLEKQEEFIHQFNKKKDEISNITDSHKVQIFESYYSQMVQILELYFNNQLKFNFLDFGGNKIDFYLYLRKHFKNINYFIFNQKNTIENFAHIKKKYNFNTLNILENLGDIRKNEYDFINFGSTIQYVPNFENIVIEIINYSKKYIFFSRTHFYDKLTNTNGKIIVKQVNMLPTIYYCYFFHLESFLKIFEEKGFQIVFKKKSFADGVNYNNFGDKYGNIQYTDLLLGKN